MEIWKLIYDNLQNYKFNKWKKEQSEKMRGNTNNRKSIFQFSLDGQFIRKWESGFQINSELKINSSHISTVCHNKRKSAGGFIWRFKEKI